MYDIKGDDVQFQCDDEKGQVQSEGDKCFGCGEIGIVGQLVDDFDGDCCYCFEWVQVYLCGGFCFQYDDYGFIDGV